MKLDSDDQKEPTKRPWVFNPHRHTHDYMIHTKRAVNEKGTDGYDIGGISSEDGVIGSSEWTWLKPVDAELICKAVNSYDKTIDLANLVYATNSFGTNSTLANRAKELAADILGHKPPPEVIGGPQL